LARKECKEEGESPRRRRTRGPSLLPKVITKQVVQIHLHHRASSGMYLCESRGLPEKKSLGKSKQIHLSCEKGKRKKAGSGGRGAKAVGVVLQSE